MSKKYFVVSDLHSYYTITKTCLEEKGWEEDNKEHILIVCGDAFDRGDETLDLYFFLLRLLNDNRLIYVKGNHDILLKELIGELERGASIGAHHHSNGTLKTFFHFLEGECIGKRSVYEIAREVEIMFDKLYKNMVNYYELGNYIFVHSYIPTKVGFSDKPLSFEKVHKYKKNWRDSSDEDWEMAMWDNPFKIWNSNVREPNKTIVCGHWNTGWAHYNLHNLGANEYDCNYTFKDNGIVGLDACVAESDKINVLVIKEDELYDD